MSGGPAPAADDAAPGSSARAVTSAPPLPGLSVVIPAFNEAGSLESVVRTVHRVAGELAARHEILVVDDGSRDATPRIAERLAAEMPDVVRVVRHPFNLGFGAAQKSGFGHARLEYVTLIPGDGQFDVDELRLYPPALSDADVVVGIRVARNDPLHRRVNTRVFRLVMRLLFGVTLHDVNWVKLFRKSVLDGIEIESGGIGVDAEIVAKAKQAGCRFAEVEVSWLPRTSGRSTGDRPLNVLITVVELGVLFYRLRLRGDRGHAV